MHLKLNYWQVSLLFIPFFIGCLLLTFSSNDRHQHELNFLIANFLSLVTMLLVIGYQSYLAITFANRQAPKAILFKANALIPVVFFFLYSIYAIYVSFIKPIHGHINTGPIRKSDLKGSSIIILLFLAHAAINFLFVNNQFVSYRIKKIQDDNGREILKSNFLGPMKTTVRTTIYLAIISIVISTVIDIIHFS
jgi:hypothetical protein